MGKTWASSFKIGCTILSTYSVEYLLKQNVVQAALPEDESNGEDLHSKFIENKIHLEASSRSVGQENSLLL
jgi:hypothetical protein